jgi:hypothetical protein
VLADGLGFHLRELGIGYVKLDRTSKRAEQISRVLGRMFSEDGFPRCSESIASFVVHGSGLLL